MTPECNPFDNINLITNPFGTPLERLYLKQDKIDSTFSFTHFRKVYQLSDSNVDTRLHPTIEDTFSLCSTSCLIKGKIIPFKRQPL